MRALAALFAVMIACLTSAQVTYDYQLLRQDRVQKELRLHHTVVKKVIEDLDKADKAMKVGFIPFERRDKQSKEEASKVMKTVLATRERAVSHLTLSQRIRLRELSIQRGLPYSLFWPDVAGDIKLDKARASKLKRELRQIESKYAGRVAAVTPKRTDLAKMTSLQQTEAARKARAAQLKLASQQKAEMAATLAKALTPREIDAWKFLQGAKFKFD